MYSNQREGQPGLKSELVMDNTTPPKDNQNPPQPADQPIPAAGAENTPPAGPAGDGIPAPDFEPSVPNLEIGQTTTINVWIEEARQLNRISLELSFNPNQIQVEDSDPDVDGIQIIPGALPTPAEVIENRVDVGD